LHILVVGANLKLTMNIAESWSVSRSVRPTAAH